MRGIIVLLLLLPDLVFSQSSANKQVAPSPAIKRAIVYTTAANTQLRLTATDTLTFRSLAQPLESQLCIFVDPAHSYQQLMGIGGAITDASAEVFAALTPARQQQIVDAYYDTEKGIGYTLARTNIHSCDFSSQSYTYIQDGDKELSTFSIHHDRQYRIPLIKKAMVAAKGKLNLFASPWSPPGFMKDNKSMLQGGKLLPSYYQSWANYFSRFIKAYEKEGVPIWGITIQNEPMAKQTWESCMYTAEEERDFLKNYLGPTLQKQGLGRKKIIMWDHNRDLIYQRSETMLKDPEAAKYVWGIGFHWYEDWSGGKQMFDNLQRVHEAFPDKPLFFTEGCNGPFNMNKIDDWKYGERYGESMINDFNSGAVAWTDWNILLDENGGPNHVGNFCFAPIHAEAKNDKLYFMNAYYYIGHFSKYIRPGARRIAASSSRSMLQTTAFVNKDGKMAVVVMNPTDQTQSYLLWIAGQAADITSLPHSIATIIY